MKFSNDWTKKERLDLRNQLDNGFFDFSIISKKLVDNPFSEKIISFVTDVLNLSQCEYYNEFNSKYQEIFDKLHEFKEDISTYNVMSEFFISFMWSNYFLADEGYYRKEE